MNCRRQIATRRQSAFQVRYWEQKDPVNSSLTHQQNVVGIQIDLNSFKYVQGTCCKYSKIQSKNESHPQPEYSLMQFKYTRGGDPPKTRIIFWRQVPCSTGFPCQVSVLGTHLYHCASWCSCERLSLPSVKFFLKTRSICLPIL